MKLFIAGLLVSLAGFVAASTQPMVIPWQLSSYGRPMFTRDGTSLVPTDGWLQRVDVAANAAHWIVRDYGLDHAISPDGRWVAYTAVQGIDWVELVVRQMSNGAEVYRLQLGSRSAGMGFSEDGQRLLVAVKPRVVREFAFTTGWAPTNREWSMPYDMESFGLVADGSRFAVTGETQATLSVWDAVTPSDQPLATFAVWPRSVVVPPSPGSNEFIVGQQIITMTGPPASWTTQEIPVPDQWRLQGNLLLSDDGASIFGIYYRWETGNIVLIAWNRQMAIRAETVLAEDQVFSSWLVRAGPGQIALDNAPTEQGVGTTLVRRNMSDLAVSKAFFRPSWSVRVSADGTHLLTGGQNSITLWNLRSNGMPVGKWERPSRHAPQYNLNLANDGTTVEVRQMFLNGPFEVLFRSPDGVRTGSDTIPNVQRPLAEVSPKPLHALGYVAAVATPSEVRLYRMSTGQFLRAVANPPGLQSTAFSPDGQKIALLGQNQLVVRRVTDGAVLADAPHNPANEPVYWHPSGDRILLPSSGELFRFTGTSLNREFVYIFSPNPYTAEAQSWTPDARVLFGRRTSPSPFLDTWRTVGSPMPYQAFPMDAFGVSVPLVHPSSRWLYFVLPSDSSILRVMTNPFAVSPPTAVTLSAGRLRGVGRTATVTVRIEGVAPMGGTPVSLQSGSPLLTVVAPASVTIPQGQNTATFTVRVASSPSAITNVGLTARNAGGSRSATVVVEPTASPGPLRVTPASSTIRKAGTTMLVTVSLRTPALTGGDAVTLSSSSPSVLAVVAPTSVTVPAGQTSARFTVRLARSVAASTPITLTATTTGGTARATVTALPDLPPAPRSVVPTPATLTGLGASATVRVTLAAAAPLGGAAVTLTSSAPTLLGVVAPATLTVPAGRTTADFRVRVLTRPVAATTTVTLTARTGTGAATARVTVRR